MFYFFFAPVAVFATPVAAIAIWRLLQRLGETQHRRLVFGVVVLCVIQLELGVTSASFAYSNSDLGMTTRRSR